MMYLVLMVIDDGLGTGEIAQSALLSVAYQANGVGPRGTWNSSSCPREYALEVNSVSKMTYAELYGGIDGKFHFIVFHSIPLGYNNNEFLKKCFFLVRFSAIQKDIVVGQRLHETVVGAGDVLLGERFVRRFLPQFEGERISRLQPAQQLQRSHQNRSRRSERTGQNRVSYSSLK